MFTNKIASTTAFFLSLAFITSITNNVVADSNVDMDENLIVYDNPTPSIHFVRPRPNEIIRSEAVLFVVKIDNYEFRPDLALKPSMERYGEGVQVANEGHYQIHLVRPGSTKVKHFAEPGSEAVRATLEPGPWCAYIALVHHDNTQRLKAHPRDLPPFDKVCFRILPPRQEAEPTPEADRRSRTEQHHRSSGLHLDSVPGTAAAGEHERGITAQRNMVNMVANTVIFSDGTIFADGSRWLDD